MLIGFSAEKQKKKIFSVSNLKWELKLKKTKLIKHKFVQNYHNNRWIIQSCLQSGCTVLKQCSEFIEFASDSYITLRMNRSCNQFTEPS
jgi:hypothetical protein